MNELSAHTHIAVLSAELLKHQMLYHAKNEPEISDEQYDAMIRELRELEAQYPECCHPNSPTKRVGAPVNSNRPLVKHARPMLSLDNAFTWEEVETRFKDVRDNVMFTVEPKYDGVSLSLVYQDGVFVQAALRGDGFEGEDVTANARTIMNIPLKIPAANGRAELRGEVVLLKSRLAAVNEWRIANKLAPYKNCRNGAAGAIRSLDPAACAAARLVFCLYDVVEGINIYEHFEQLQNFHKNIAPILNTAHIMRCNLNTVPFCYERLQAERGTLDFEIDGMVIKVDYLPMRESMGATSIAPRWAIAWKFPPKPVQSTVKNIRVQVGRTGAITPVVDIEPVECSGVTVTKATLHNAGQIERLGGIAVGDTIWVQRGGDVIPDVAKIEHDPNVPSWRMPAYCPSCNSTLTTIGAKSFCLSPHYCRDKLCEKIQHSAKMIKMDGVGPAEAVLLVDVYGARSLADFYTLNGKEREIPDSPIPRKAIVRLPYPQQMPLWRFIACLCIEGVGEITAQKVEQLIGRESAYGDFEVLREISLEKLQKELGREVGAELYTFVNAEEARIIRSALNPLPATRPAANTLAGMSIVVTGTLKGYTRDSIKEAIRGAGGKVSESVSKKTTLVLAGESPGSKLDNAKRLSIRVLNEDQFNAILNGQSI